VTVLPVSSPPNILENAVVDASTSDTQVNPPRAKPIRIKSLVLTSVLIK